MNQYIIPIGSILAGTLTWLLADVAAAQPAVRLPQAAANSASPGVYPPGASPAGAAPISSPALGGAPSGAAGSTLGAPSFDPYGSSAGMSGYNAGTPIGGAASPYGGGAAAGAGGPTVNVPIPAGSAPGGGAVPYGGAAPAPYGTVPPAAMPGASPPALFPNGLNTTAWGAPPLRFITPRVRYTWVAGGDQPDALGIHDFDFSAAMAFPQFLFSTQPLYVVPSFSLHLWSGPEEPTGDLPSKAYSAFADFGWGTDPSRPVSGELGVRLGLFTDFETMNSRSFRVLGQGLFRVQTTETLALRGGVIYLNRNKIKLLPAGGVLWTPNAQTRFDIFFPRPKLAQRLTTLGNADLWWYVGGEYGGGSWTIQRSDGTSDRVDINDLRLILGVEWGQAANLQQGHRTGFIEAGWVTDRELVYVRTPNQNPSLKDSFMVRAGFNY